MDVVEAMHGWRSIRAYRPEPVARDVVEDLLWHAVQVSTPPASEPPWALGVLEGVARIEGYGRRALEFARAHRPPGAPGWSWTERPGFRVFWGAPTVVVICARSGSAETPFDCCRAGQNLALAAHARGLGACWVGAPLPWLRSPGVAESLGLPAGFDPAVAMLLGHPAERPAPKSRPRPPVIWCG
jgi:nitroreductase